METLKQLNNARMQTLGAYVAIYDIECIDTKQQIYRGRRYVEPEQREQDWPWIYFHRRYYPDINDFDKIYVEIELPEDMFGVKMTLVPKEKLLFFYMPKSLIALPAPKPFMKLRRQ